MPELGPAQPQLISTFAQTQNFRSGTILQQEKAKNDDISATIKNWVGDCGLSRKWLEANRTSIYGEIIAINLLKKCERQVGLSRATLEFQA